jgi:large subunit ribosomal protein L14
MGRRGKDSFLIMLQLRSIVNVADNTGAKKVGVFKVLGGTRRRYARIGDIVVVSVKVAEPRKAVKKKDILKAVVVRQKSPLRRRDGTVVRFDDNAVVILDGREPKGGRIFGPIPREIKDKGFQTIASLAQELV